MTKLKLILKQVKKKPKEESLTLRLDSRWSMPRLLMKDLEKT